jgi:hypothetical protein
MQAFKIGNIVIAADTPDEASEFYRHEIDPCVPSAVTDVDRQTLINCQNGLPKTIKDIINDIMDERNAWLRMSIPCDLHYPFIITKNF